MILKAKVYKASSEDPEGFGRVILSCPDVWEPSEGSPERWIPVLGAQPLNPEDVVFVLVEDSDFMNPLVLGRCHDRNFVTSGSRPENFSVVWESVSVAEGTWSVMYVLGSTLIVENSSETIIKVEGGKVAIMASGHGSDELQPVPLGNDLVTQLEYLTGRVTAMEDFMTNPAGFFTLLETTINGIAPGTGTALKVSLTSSLEGALAGTQVPSWGNVLNRSVETAGEK